MENNRNYFVAIALSVLILIAWQFLYINPKIEKERIAAEQTQANPAAGNQTTAGQTATGQTPAGVVPGGNESREQAIAKSARVTIDTPALSGSINLTGARLDDLKLKEYHETVDDKSPIITLLSPAPCATLTASRTSGRAGSIMPSNPTKTRSRSISDIASSYETRAT